MQWYVLHYNLKKYRYRRYSISKSSLGGKRLHSSVDTRSKSDKLTLVIAKVVYDYCMNIYSGRHYFLCNNIGIKHSFPCINVCQVPREMLKSEVVSRGFQHLPRDMANVNVLENNSPVKLWGNLKQIATKVFLQL